MSDSNNNFSELEGTNFLKEELPEGNFIDLYDFLGIPPSSSPNLIYLAISKIENSLQKLSDFPDMEQNLVELEKKLEMSRDKLLYNSVKRVAYEHEWESYYFPKNGAKETDIECTKNRCLDSKLLKIGLKNKSSPLSSNIEQSNFDNFNYKQDFHYLMMRDRPKEKDVFLLNTEEMVQLPPLTDSIFFENKQFCLRTYGQIKICITNDALGKSLLLNQKKTNIPLHIGDRMEFESGTRLILRGFYIKQNKSSVNNAKDWAMYFEQEKILIPLQQEKIYIIGRNTSDIRNLAFDEDIFCFINIGRRERSISRQNFQMFFRDGDWYLQDLGSRYGITLDFEKHNKLETLAGGSIMALETGKIRLGYDKSYVIQIATSSDMKNRKKREAYLPNKSNPLQSIYDLSLL